MRISAVAALMILTTVLLSACQQETKAAWEDKSGQFYGRSAFANAPTYQAAQIDSIISTPITATPAPMPAPMKVAQMSPVAPSGSWAWPVNGQVTEKFGTQGNGIANEGITISAAS